MTLHSGYSDRQLYRAILRNHLSPFIQRAFATVSPGDSYSHNWHIEAIAHHLELCLEGRIRRLLITVPPRSLKSIASSVAFATWVLGKKPTASVICASYSAEFAHKHGRDRRKVVGEAWYQDLFPGTRLARSPDSAAEFATTVGGFCQTTSVGGVLTGRGADFIIIDDANKADDARSKQSLQNVIDWFRGTVLSRLNNKQTGVIIVIQQRIHEHDLAGFLVKEEGWTHLNLPAIADRDLLVPTGNGVGHFRKEGSPLHGAREPLDVLEKLRREMGTDAFEAQYLQRPNPPGGTVFQRSWFKKYTRRPDILPGHQIVQSWDTASTIEERSDYSVCTTWIKTEKACYLLDVLRRRVEFPDLKRLVLAHARAWGASVVLIEWANSGIQLVQELRREPGITAIPIKVDGGKENRAIDESPMIEAGDILLPVDAPWIGEFLNEVLTFPHGAFDDQVDSMTQFLYWVRTGRNRLRYGLEVRTGN